MCFSLVIQDDGKAEHVEYDSQYHKPAVTKACYHKGFHYKGKPCHVEGYSGK